MSTSRTSSTSKDEHFRALSIGPQFVVVNAYFDKVRKDPKTASERQTRQGKVGFQPRGFHSKGGVCKYFLQCKLGSNVPAAEKSRQSLSNCAACATQFEELQKLFPLKPLF